MTQDLRRSRSLTRHLGCVVVMLLWQFACSGGDPNTTEKSSHITSTFPTCPSTTNVAPNTFGTVVTAAPSVPGLNGTVAGINDGDLTTFWVGDGDSTTSNTVTLNFHPALTLSEVDLVTSSSVEVREYDIQLKNNGSVTNLPTVQNSPLQTTVKTTFPPTVADTLLIIGRKGSKITFPVNLPNALVINEIQVSGCIPPTRVTGHVTGVNGAPLKDVSVEIGGKPPVLTPADGSYTVSGLDFGTYTVHASKAGFTFGSAQFQIDRHSVTLNPTSPTATMNIVGYNRNPIVYVHGWTSKPERFQTHPAPQLQEAGYAPYYAKLVTDLTFTPPFETNVTIVSDKINQAKYETGQPKVILIAHSMGGLVARTYLETSRYNNDVSQFFSFGTPHLGIPRITMLACVPTQPAVCEMTAPSMALFNLTHARRAGVDYHEIGGDAPMLTSLSRCFRIHIFSFNKKICVSIPWPDTTFRSNIGWLMGNLIGGPDDGLIGTCSAVGQPGSNIDRFITQEAHDGGQGGGRLSLDVANRDYFTWNGSNRSRQSYDQCLKRILVDGSTGTCGTRNLRVGSCLASPGPLFAAAPLPFAAAGPQLAASISALQTEPSTTPAAGQRAAPQFGQLTAGQQMTRTVIVEGGGTTFSTNVQSGSATLSLIDPTGQVIDPTYVASISDVSPDDPEAEETTDAPNDAVTYTTSDGSAQYFLPNARPGIWTVVVKGNADLPADGSPFTTDVGFDSTFLANFSPSTSFLTPGTTARFTIQLPPVASAVATMSITLSDGSVIPLAPVATDAGYTAAFDVPATSGYAHVTWSITGTRNDGVAFERGGVEDVQVTSPSLSWGGVTSESTVARSIAPALVQTLVLQARVDSSYAGDAEIAADLVDGGGTVVAHVTQPLSLAIGANSVALKFSGDDVYATGLNGPYTLTNLVVLDTRAGSVLATTAANTYVTAPYPAARFALSPGIPSVTTTGPYTVSTGDTLNLVANGVDPEGDPLRFAWDLDGDGLYETSGRVVSYTAPASPASATVGVRVTDPSGNSQTTTTTIDVFPREVNLSLQATASASSTLAGYSTSHVNDGNISTVLDPSASWANESHFECTFSDLGPVCTLSSSLPATLDLDLGGMKTVTRVVLSTSESFPIQDYDLAIWDGTAFNVVDHVRGNTEVVRTHNFAPTVGSKVRITGYKGPDAQPYLVRVNELQAFGF